MYKCKICKKQFKTEVGYAEHLCKDDLTDEDLELIRNVKVIIIKDKKELERILEEKEIEGWLEHE